MIDAKKENYLKKIEKALKKNLKKRKKFQIQLNKVSKKNDRAF